MPDSVGRRTRAVVLVEALPVSALFFRRPGGSRPLPFWPVAVPDPLTIPDATLECGRADEHNLRLVLVVDQDGIADLDIGHGKGSGRVSECKKYACPESQ
jgi:hypothetical protein